MKTQVAIFEIQPDMLRAMLGLPEGTVISGVREPIDKLGVLQLRVEGMGWSHREGTMIPMTCPVVTMRPATPDDLVPQVDWRCPLPGDAPE